MARQLLQLWLCGLLLSPLATRAEPSININTGYYPVFGLDSQSIHQSILQNGPTGNDGQRFHAYTQWKVNWSYRWTESASRCRLTRLTVAIDIDYMLPELQSAETLSEALKSGWERYFQALFSHEQQHKEFGIEAARTLEKSLLAIPEQPCSTFEASLADTAEQILDDYHQREIEFDLETNHGINQGVILP
jgi:predicted secreted Zn-dependent protease